MELRRRAVLQGAAAASFLGAVGLTAYEAPRSWSSSDSSTGTASLTFDRAAWHYDADNDVYWQLGRSYVSRPAATDCETLGVYVPGAYLKETKNSDGTYTADLNPSGTVAGFTARTAPIVLPSMLSVPPASIAGEPGDGAQVGNPDRAGLFNQPPAAVDEPLHRFIARAGAEHAFSQRECRVPVAVAERLMGFEHVRIARRGGRGVA